MPEDDRGELNLAIETPPGSNLDYTRIKIDEASAHCALVSGNAAHAFATVGGASGAVDAGGMSTCV